MIKAIDDACTSAGDAVSARDAWRALRSWAGAPRAGALGPGASGAGAPGLGAPGPGAPGAGAQWVSASVADSLVDLRAAVEEAPLPRSGLGASSQPAWVLRRSQLVFRLCVHPLEHRYGPLVKERVTASCLVHETAYFNASGWMLLNLYDGNNDMQVTQEAAKLDTPLSTHLACLHANHWDISFGSFPVSMTLGSRKLVHPFPKQAALTAMLVLVHELGLNDKA